jgi:hypothetical protein
LLDRLTYQQFCALAYFLDPNNKPELGRIQREAEEDGSRASPALLSELFELANLGLLGAWQGDPKEVLSFGETVATFGGGIPVLAKNASRLALTPLGENLARLAELRKIPMPTCNLLLPAFGASAESQRTDPRGIQRMNCGHAAVGDRP